MSDLSSGDTDLGLGPTLRGFRAGQQVFGTYRLVRVLGRGGMGVVWLARDETLEREVALKFLPEEVAQDRLAVADLKRETNRSLQLNHHHIVRVHYFLQDKVQDLVAISMEYVDGDNLSNLRAEREHRCFEVEELGERVRSLCEALEYAHGKARIIHRDLKPANLMLTSGGDLKVADFGIARSLVDSASRVSMGTAGTSGTLVYMSPQQAIGRGTTALDDIYSLGATLYDLLTGKPPFYTGIIIHQVETVVPPLVSERRAELKVHGAPIPATWEIVIAACLEKDPARRPQSAMEVAWRLGLVKNYEPKLVSQISTPTAPPPRSALEHITADVRNRKGAMIGALVAFIVAGALGGWWFGAERPRREAERQRQASEQKATAEQNKESARQQALAEKERLAREAKAKRDAEAEQERLAAEQRAKEEEAKKKEEALKGVAAATKAKPYENSLGMKFVPVPGTNVLFSVWETRVKDFEAFVKATGQKAEGDMASLDKGGWWKGNYTWTEPGFSQTKDHPICGVSWENARTFCVWLTELERKAGRISTSESYRLPSDDEWSAAVGLKRESGTTPKSKDSKVQGIYPWGTTFPPPQDTENYAGTEARTGNWPLDKRTIDGYRDGYARTAPVGTFAANPYGIHDLGGNVEEWCNDSYGEQTGFPALRGASWRHADPYDLLSSHRSIAAPDLRLDYVGFRCVLVVDSSR